MKNLFKNPLSIYINWSLKAILVLNKNRNKNLKLGYLSEIKDTKIGIFNTFYDYVSLYNCIVNDYVYIASNTQISNCEIGKFCSIGSDVKIGLGKHPTNFMSTFPAFYSNKRQCQISFTDKDHYEENGKNIIGNDVWIGSNCIILSDVIIGDGSIIAAGSVVTKDVAPYSIVGGIPAKLIRKRFSEEKIIELLSLKWWDKDIDWLKKNVKHFQKVLK